MQFEIKHRWSGAVLFSCELSAEVAGQEYRFQLGFAVRKAVEARAYLTYANLTYANLTYADLTGAGLTYADLTGADLTGANLTGANLTGANLTGANLTRAYLTGAYLTGAKTLPDAWTTTCRDDLWAILSAAPFEVSGLRAALAEGRVDGSTYSGECACLVGTIANLRGTSVDALDIIKPNSRRAAEQWFMGIKRGDRPETNPFSARALEWTDQWLAAMRAAFGAPA